MAQTTLVILAALSLARARWVWPQGNLELHVASAEPEPPPATEEDDDRGLTFPEGQLLPDVTCITYVTLNGSKELPLFEAQMKALGLWDRVTVQASPPDPDGKAAGCWRGHVKAWNDALQRGCEHALVVEEDLYFEEGVVEAGMKHANALVASGAPYDMLFLGYTPEVNLSSGITMEPFQQPSAMLGSVATYANDVDDLQCVYRLRRWLCTQSYIISRAAMARWANLTYDLAAPLPIDYFLSTRQPYADSAYFAIRPMIGFQRYHTAPEGVSASAVNGRIGSPFETFKFIPGVVYSIFEPELFATKAGIASPAACLPPPKAYSWAGLEQQAILIITRALSENSTFCFPYAQAPPAGSPPLPVIETGYPAVPTLTFPAGWPKTCLTVSDLERQIESKVGDVAGGLPAQKLGLERALLAAMIEASHMV